MLEIIFENPIPCAIIFIGLALIVWIYIKNAVKAGVKEGLEEFYASRENSTEQVKQ